MLLKLYLSNFISKQISVFWQFFCSLIFFDTDKRHQPKYKADSNKLLTDTSKLFDIYPTTEKQRKESQTRCGFIMTSEEDRFLQD